MNVLIKSAKIISPSSPYHGKVQDILIKNGQIESIKSSIKPAEKIKTIEEPNLHVSIGWFDMKANLRDPGFEHQEDLASGTKAAAAGGFTGLLLMPGTNPPIHSKSQVEYVLNKTKNNIVDVYPAATVSVNQEGKEMAELFDMHTSGAVAFTDDKKSIADPGLLSKAMLYTKIFKGLIINYPNDKAISGTGIMNEGQNNILLGMKGIPSLAEELMVARDIAIAEYNDSPIHLSNISTAKSVALIKSAKAKGTNVTADVAAHHLALDDSYLGEFDTNYKVKPPLRSKADVKALKKGLSDGTIDCIASDHCPENEENKHREFEHASYGTIGLETAFALANTSLSELLGTDELIEKLAVNPRKILNIPMPAINEGEEANLTLFDPNMEWTFSEKMFSLNQKTHLSSAQS